MNTLESKPRFALPSLLRSAVAAMGFACALPLAAGTLFFEDFQTPDISGYEQGTTPPDRWVRAVNGYGSGDHGMVDTDSGDFTAPAGSQGYSCRYTNSGITTAEGVFGPPLAANGNYEVSFDVVKNNSNGGRSYNVRLVAFTAGAVRNDCITLPAGSGDLANATGNAPDNGSIATVTFTFSAAASHLGKDLGVRFVGSSNSAIIDNIRVKSIPGPNPGVNVVTTTPLDNNTKALVYQPLLAVFDKNIAAGTGNITIRNLTDVSDSTFPVSDPRVFFDGTHLKIQAADLLQWNKSYAILIDAGAIVETPSNAPFAGIATETTWNFTTAAGDPLLYSISRLKSHIQNNITLTAGEISGLKVDLDSVAYRFAESADTITALLDLVATYDTSLVSGRKGPLWVATSLPKRDVVTNDLAWTMFNVMQNIMDRIYNTETVATHHALLSGKKFNSSSNFPGNCAVPAPNVHTATVWASYLDTFGKATISDGEFTFARKPTGTYLAPGTIVTVTVPPALINAGYKLRVGAHSSDFKAKPDIKRLDRVSRTYDITSATTKIANPLGGGIYLEVPWLANAGVVTIDISGAARSPYFSAKTFHSTTVSQWETIERNNPGPWADFQTDKFMMQVPKGWVSAMTGAQAVTLMAGWDASMDAMHDLLGYPRIRGKESLYPQVDLLLKNSVYAPGYPSVNTTYNPVTNYGGYGSSHLVRGAQFAPYYEFHELGHGYFFPKFAGESESTVNFLHVAVMNRAFGKSLDEGHGSSMGGYRPFLTVDNTAIAWMTVFNFSPREVPMDSGEKSYQLKGHAKFVDIVRLYGWDKLDDFWYGMMLAEENGTPYSTSDDALLLRLCQAVGKDVRPLFHFWGIHPQNPASLAASIAAANLPGDVAIRNHLLHYKSIVPADNAAFRTFATGWWNKQPSITGYWEQREHARQWDTAALYGPGDQQRSEATNPGEIYNENSANDIRNRIDELINLYYPGALSPAQLSFALAPSGIDATTIGMTATTATSGNGTVEYYFENLTNSTNSGWITSPSWSSTGLTTGNTYQFRVQARDGFDITAWSATASAASVTDTTPPAPNPMTFASAPASTGLDSITMTATTATDINGIEYNFVSLTPGGHSSGWQDSTVYTDTGLTPSTAYSYQVLARDKSPAQNVTTASASASATTDTPDTTPPSVLSLSPADNATDVALAVNFLISFNELVLLNTGSITIKNLTDATETVIDINDAAQVTHSGDDLTINPTTNLLPGKNYAVQISATAIQDLLGNDFPGINDDTTWNFTTAVVPYVWTQTTGNAQNWTTGANWQGGAIPNPTASDTIDFSTVNIAANTTITLEADRIANLWKFGDTSGNNTWTINSGNKIVLAGSAPTIQVNTATTTLNNVVDGNAGLTKTGGGTLSLANTANTYTGGTTISAGHLSIAGNGSLGSGGITFNANGNFTVPNGITLNRALTLNNNAVVTFPQSNASATISGAVTGTGGLVPSVAGSSTLTLSSLSNTFTGPITLGSGIQPSTIVLNSLADGSGKIYLGSPSGYGAGAFRWNTGATSPLVLTSRQFVLGSGSGGYYGAIENANTDPANTITVNSNLAVGAGNGTARQLRLAGANTGNNTFAGIIADGVDTYAGVIVNLSKAGAGTWIVLGENTFTGKTTIEQGTLTVSSLNRVTGGAASSSLGAPTTVGNGTIEVGTSGSTTAGILRYTGSGETTDRNLSLVSRTGGLTINHAGTGLLKFSGSLAFPGVAGQDSRKTLTLQASSSATGELDGVIANSTLGNSGQLTTTLSKSGNGTWNLNGNNSYTGTTTVSAGKLFVNGDQTAANGAVSVSALATLGGKGTIGGAVTIAATGKLEFNLSTNAAGHDKLDLGAGKALTFSGASTLTITSASGAAPGVYTLLTAPGGITGAAPATLVLPANWTGSVAKNGSNLELTVTSVGNTFTSWISTFPGVGSLTAFNDDADGDGISNGVENYFGTDPSASTTGMKSSGFTGTVYTFTHPQNPNPVAGLTATLFWSKNLTDYYPTGATDVDGTTVTFNSSTNTPVTGTTTITATVTGTPTTKIFVRIAVTAP